MATTVTITEALAELKTLDKRIENKRQSILANGMLARQEGLKDPLEREGGSREFIKRERQGIHDLEQRKIAIRTAIQQTNHQVYITLDDTTRTIAEWLTWRKEIAPDVAKFFQAIRGQLSSMRQRAQGQGIKVVGDNKDATTPLDVVVNIDEVKLSEEIEMLSKMVGDLDGQLSLKNATVMVSF